MSTALQTWISDQRTEKKQFTKEQISAQKWPWVPRNSPRSRRSGTSASRSRNSGRIQTFRQSNPLFSTIRRHRSPSSGNDLRYKKWLSGFVKVTLKICFSGLFFRKSPRIRCSSPPSARSFLGNWVSASDWVQYPKVWLLAYVNNYASPTHTQRKSHLRGLKTKQIWKWFHPQAL